MPHLTIEYTDNLRGQTDIPALLQSLNDVLIAQTVFPVGGIRTRAIELQHYCVADGKADDAFVHASLKIGAGRAPDAKARTCAALFDTLKRHFEPLFATRSLALSLELHEFREPTLKHSNVHARFRSP